MLWNDAGKPDLKGKTEMQTLLPPACRSPRPCRFFNFLLFAILTTLAIPYPASQSAQTGSSIQVYFSPRGGCQDAIVREVNNARHTIRIQAYYLTNAAIARAVRDAHRCGVSVEIILDKSQQTSQYSSATFFQNAGIPVFIDNKHAIAHDKVMILDKDTVITGSFNFTEAAEQNNAENLLIIKGYPNIAAAYLRNYEKHKAHSVSYKNPMVTKPEETAF